MIIVERRAVERRNGQDGGRRSVLLIDDVITPVLRHPSNQGELRCGNGAELRAPRFRQWMQYSRARLSSSELSRLPRGRQDSLPNQSLRIELLNARNDPFRRHVDEYAVKESDNKSGLAG